MQWNTVLFVPLPTCSYQPFRSSLTRATPAWLDRANKNRGIQRNTMEYHGGQWNAVEYCGIVTVDKTEKPWNTFGPSRMRRKPVKYSGIQCSTLLYSRLQQNTMEYDGYSGIHRNATENRGMSFIRKPQYVIRIPQYFVRPEFEKENVVEAFV